MCIRDSRNVLLAAFHCECKTSGQDFFIQPETVLVIFLADLDAGGFAICDHHDLFVGISTLAQYLHRQFKTGYGIGMVRPYFEIW